RVLHREREVSCPRPAGVRRGRHTARSTGHRRVRPRESVDVRRRVCGRGPGGGRAAVSAIALRVLSVLRPLGSHLAAYAELGTAVACEYRKAWVRRLCWAAVALVATLLGLAATWVIGLAAFWDTRWRMTYVI